MSSSGCSYAKAIAGIISVPKSMQRISTVVNGSGNWKRMKAMKGIISGMLEVRVYAIDFLRLSKIKRPSAIPSTIELKSSF